MGHNEGTTTGANKQRYSGGGPVESIAALLEWGCLLIALLTILQLTIFPIQDFDIWWNLAAGREIIQTGRFVDHDMFTCTIEGQPWMNKYPVFGVVAFLLFDRGGAAALIALRTALVLTTFLLLLICARGFRTPCPEDETGGTFSPVWSAAVVLAGAVLLSARTFVRPELFSFVMFSAMLLMWEGLRGRAMGKSRIAGLLALTVLWTNLHSAFMLGFVISGLYLLERTIGMRGRNRREWLILPAMLAASLLNPWGPKATLAVLGVMREPLFREILIEWLPMLSNVMAAPERTIFLVSLTIAACGFVLAGKKARLSHLGLLLCMAALTLKSRRHGGFYALAFTLSALWNIRAILSGLGGRWRGAGRRMAMAGAVFILIALMSMSITAGTFFSRVFGVARPFGFGIQTQLYPVLAARFMRESGLRGNLFHNYDSGGYLIWHLQPNVKTCIDGRAEPFPIGMIKEHWRIFSADSDPHGFMEKYGMDLALIDFDDRGLLKYFKGRPQWALCHIGERTALFVKRTDAQASFIEQYEIPPPEKSGAAKARLVFPPPGETAKIFPYTSSEILAARRGAILEELGYPGGWALPVTNTDGHP